MSTFATILAELADPTARLGDEYNSHNPQQLADDAGCGNPDSPDSPGAKFLAGIARDVADYFDSAPDDRPDTFRSINAELTDGDGAHEIADGAVPAYTHERWQVFVDLGAYNEDPTEIGATADDLTEAAGVALYLIASRLVAALAQELAEALDEDDEGEDDEIECKSCTNMSADPVRVDGGVYCEGCAPEPTEA